MAVFVGCLGIQTFQFFGSGVPHNDIWATKHNESFQFLAETFAESQDWNQDITWGVTVYFLSYIKADITNFTECKVMLK